MATAGSRGRKTTFIRDLYDKDPKVNFEEANRAWKAAGNEGDLSRNTFANLKSAFRKEDGGASDGGTVASKPRDKSKSKGTKARRATRPATATNGQEAASTPAPRTPVARGEAGRERLLVEAESDLDGLLDKLKGVGGLTEVEETLRTGTPAPGPAARGVI